MTRGNALYCCALTIVLLMVSGLEALQAARAQIDITPPESIGVPMSGYARGYEARSEGVHDSLQARVLLLDDGRQRIVILSVDLIGFNVGFDSKRGRLAEMFGDMGLDGWLVVSTHTHGGPRVLDLQVPYRGDRSWPSDDPYTNWLEDRIAEAVRAAQSELQPVRVWLGSGQVDISFNRRLVRADGTVEMIWGRASQFRRQELGPTDPEVGVIRFENSVGEPIAILFNYACHAVVLGAANRQLTADFPGYASRYIEAEMPGATAFFLQGAAGDLDPFIDVQSSFRPAQSQGETLGEEVVRAASDVGNMTPLPADLALDWQIWQREFRRYYNRKESLLVSFGVLRLGRELAFLALPGEPFVDLQLYFKQWSPVSHSYLLGYANGYAGYFPTRKAHLEGGYGANSGDILHLEPSAGEIMVDMGLDYLNRTIWSSALPDTLFSGSAQHLMGVLTPGFAVDDSEDIFADLSALGGSSRQLLSRAEQRDYVLNVDLPSGLPLGMAQISFYRARSGWPDVPLTRHRLMVLPSADLEIWRDRLAAGWQVVGRGGAKWRESTEGDGALAIELDLPATSSLSAFWTLDWQPPAALGRRGFAYLRFEIHPGNTRADKAPHMAFMINSTTVNLEDQVDLGSARWQRVEIPLDELGSEDAIERLRFWGRSTGTFYLREMAFIVAAELRSTLVHAPVVPPVGALLAPNSPNPFNGSTEIHYAVPIAQAVELSIYNLAGQRVAVLVEGVRRAGAYSVRWDGRGSDGRAQASGVYLYRLRMARGREETRKLLLLR